MQELSQVQQEYLVDVIMTWIQNEMEFTQGRMSTWKQQIIYASVHHENTKKVVEAIAGENVVDLIDATKEKKEDLSGYDLIGFCFRGILWKNFIRQY